jgi:hypothetical protein
LVIATHASATSAAALHSAPLAPARGLGKAWLLATALLSAYYLIWWSELRPGVFTADSASYLTQALTGKIANAKPFLYARFLQLATLGGHHLMAAALVQALIGTLILGRLFALGWVHRASAAALALCALVAVSPYFATMIFYVQNDPLFCLAMFGVLGETLHCVRRGCVGRDSAIIVALLAPMALLFRQNGLLFLPLWAVVLPFLMPRAQAWRLLVPAAATCLLAWTSIIGVRTDTTLNTKFPAVIHAISGLARPEHGKPVGSRLSGDTRNLIGAFKLYQAVDYYSPGYWDYVGFAPDGPQFILLPQDRQRAIVRSFVKHDLVANFPAVMAIRTELWLSILMGRGMPVSASENPPALPYLVSRAKAAHPPAGGRLTRTLTFVEQTPWMRSSVPGLAILLVLALLALWRRDPRMLWATALIGIQVAVIFVLAPSSDSRYLLSLYLAPFLGLLPDAWSLRSTTTASMPTNDSAPPAPGLP